MKPVINDIDLPALNEYIKEMGGLSNCIKFVKQSPLKWQEDVNKKSLMETVILWDQLNDLHVVVENAYQFVAMQIDIKKDININ